MGIVAAIVAVVSAIASAAQQNKARRDRKRAAEVARRREALKTRRAQIENIEAFRQSVGQITNIAAQTGAEGASGVLGAQASLTSQVSANVVFNEQLLQFAETQGRLLDKAALADFRASSFAAIGKIASSFAGGGGS